MENAWAIVVLSWLVAVLLAIISKIKNPRKRVPPGPKTWPILGNLHQLSSLPHIPINKLVQKYGDIMQIRFGSCPVVVASSPKMAEEFLKTYDHLTASRPSLAAGKYTGYNYHNMTWAPYGPHWRLGRKIYSTELFNPKRLDSFQKIREEERQKFLSRLYAERGNQVKLKNHIKRFTLSSISRVVLSNMYFSEQKENEVVTLDELQEMLDEWILLNGVINIGDWVPWLSGLDLQGYIKRMKAVQKKFDKFYDHIIADHKATRKDVARNEYVAKDMVDVLLQLAEEETDPELKLDMNRVKALIHDLMPGGTDTSTTTMEWVFHELLRQPHLIKKATDELDRVIGRERWVGENDVSQLPYIEAIIKEAFRLHPLSPLLAPHYTIEDCNIAGYHIAKGTSILINTYGIGRHPDHWDEPNVFKPERFLQGKEIVVTGQDYSLLPFGSGRRRCPGYNLGLKIVRTTVANLLHGFNWKLPEGMRPEDVSLEERYGLTTSTKYPVTVIPEPRLPAHLYQ